MAEAVVLRLIRLGPSKIETLRGWLELLAKLWGLPGFGLGSRLEIRHPRTRSATIIIGRGMTVGIDFVSERKGIIRFSGKCYLTACYRSSRG